MKRKMLLSKCHCGLTCAIEVEHEPKPLDLTIFPETLNKFFEEDVIQKYKDNLSLLETKILMMNNVDFNYNTKKIITEISEHKDT